MYIYYDILYYCPSSTMLINSPGNTITKISPNNSIRTTSPPKIHIKLASLTMSLPDKNINHNNYR